MRFKLGLNTNYGSEEAVVITGLTYIVVKLVFCAFFYWVIMVLYVFLRESRRFDGKFFKISP